MSAVQARYDNPDHFQAIDRWHRYTAEVIRHEIRRAWNSLATRSDQVILNAGAGGNDLGLRPPPTINLDISAARLSSMPNPIVASVEAIPFPENSIDGIICVGSVINYCDAAAAISECARILRPGGFLIIEFESSYSAELVTQESFRRAAAVAETFYAGRPEAVWVYSPVYIYNLLNAAGFNLTRKIPIHILSPWTLLLLRSSRLAAFTAPLDRFLRAAPLLTRWASNHLIFCEKRTLLETRTL